MKRLVWWICAVAVLGVAESAVSAEMNMKEGRWEITTSMDVPGMPFKAPPMIYTQCITKDKAVPSQDPEKNTNCRMLDQSVKGNTVRWTIECKEGKDRTTATGEVTYKGTSFSGMTKVISTQMANQEMMSKMSGRWLGPCEAKGK